MRILIVSDTHRQNNNYLKVLERVKPVDMVIHCGDVEGSEYTISKSAGCPVEMVAGNNDYFTDLPREKEFQIGNYHVWLTHGHNYYVAMENAILKEEARSRGADIVMYGHTHKPSLTREEDLITLNPGSVAYPRQQGRRPSYMVMELEPEGEVKISQEWV